MKTLWSASMLVAAMACTQPAVAASDAENLEKLRSFATTGTALELKTVPQDTPQAEAIRKTLQGIKLPSGFRIELYALVPDARHMAVGPSSGVVFVGTRKSNVWAVTDRAKRRVADEVKPFAPSLSFNIPNGVCFTPDGFLYVVEHNRVLVFPAAEFFYEGPDVAADIVVPQGELVPVAEESFNHGARTCRIGPDNKLYITLGNPYNVPGRDKLELYANNGMMGILRMDRDGKNREVFAQGVRNSVGTDFNPKDGVLWFTDNQVDGMGDDIPPGEINRATSPGQHFGFPYYGGGKIRTVEYKDDAEPANVVFPEVETDAHAADLGMAFYKGKMFPEKYQGGFFTAQHGSWNRTQPIGARVLFTSLNEDGTAGETEIFAEGWLHPGEYMGRPVDVAMLPDGSMLVSDDFAGAIYRISYEGGR